MGQKVRVTNLFGGGASIGGIDPKEQMQTNQGKIINVTNDICTLTSGDHYAGGSGRYEYADKLFILYSHATGVWSFPTGDGSQLFARTGEFPNGTPVINATGTAIMVDGGNLILHFGR
jgi:hypothetical protein